MYYRIRHLTRFQYSAPVTESLMEVRMHPRTEAQQRCLNYQLAVTPKARIHVYRDFLGNNIHHFGIPGAHRQLQVMAESVVEMNPRPESADEGPPGSWDDLDRAVGQGDFWEMLLPSHFAKPTNLLKKLMARIDAVRRDDPFSLVVELNARLYDAFDYVPDSTSVDSPIDHALSLQHGVCQDFAHIMIAVLRELRIPARYISGYLYHGRENRDRSADGATHAWVEAFLPSLGWTGFDPTNNLLARDRHLRTALGRDYADVPPNRGVFKGKADTRLSVAVSVTPCEELPPELVELVMTEDRSFQEISSILDAAEQEQQMQQQQ
jgi:transglutaminase-like putative cysteine protease